MTFKSGSSVTALEHENHIKTIAAQAGGNAFFLVVGSLLGSLIYLFLPKER